jgi:hypothetical protein
MSVSVLNCRVFSTCPTRLHGPVVHPKIDAIGRSEVLVVHPAPAISRRVMTQMALGIGTVQQSRRPGCWP